MAEPEEAQHLVAGATSMLLLQESVHTSVSPLPRVGSMQLRSMSRGASHLVQDCVHRQPRTLAVGAALLLFAGTMVCLVSRPLLGHALRGEVVQRVQDKSADFSPVIGVEPTNLGTPGDLVADDATGSVEELKQKAVRMQEHSTELWRSAQAIIDSVDQDKASIEEALKSAEVFRKSAEEHRATSVQKLQEAKAVEESAVEAKVAAEQHRDDALDRVERAARLMQKGRAMEKRVAQILEKARAAEVTAREEVYFFRVCVDLVGVKLKGSQNTSFAPMLPSSDALDSLSTWERCQARCQKHTSCRQAVWSDPGKECKLYHGATVLPLAFEATSNSSYCGALELKYDMLDMVRVVSEKDPASFGDPSKEIAAAPVGAAVIGHSLFCFTVVLAIDSNKAIAGNIKRQQLSICRCDESLFVNAVSSTGMGDNVEPFIKAWALVGKEGLWQHHDWTVKVDTDAVFFPERLKQHLLALRTPEGAAVYIRNSETQFHLIGTIEALTREAMHLHFLRAERCRYDVHSRRGEDGWLQWCLESIGVDYQTDFNLLSRQLGPAGDCNDKEVAAFPFYNDTQVWNKCHSQADYPAHLKM